jgi:GNAT superfamily N-acetyltransferase
MDMKLQELIIKLEELAANSWPAPLQQPFEHWQLRAGNGVTMRANSVLTSGAAPETPNWLEDITAFYEALSLVLRFHISAATNPQVDLFLEKQGLIIQSPSAVYQAVCNDIINKQIKLISSLDIKIVEHFEDEWLEDFLRLEQHPLDRKSTYEQIFSGLKLRSCYLRLYDNGELVGLGTAALDGAWAGFGNIITSQNQRNKGVGTRIVHELALWSKLNGAEWIFLQVMRGNDAALNLYGKLGFTHVYDYHYRTRL